MPVYLETFPFPVLIQDIFRTVVDRILEHLYRCWIEGGVYTAPFTDGGLHLGDRGQPFVERLYICSIPECGMLVGISRKEPSFRLGINSCPMPLHIQKPNTMVAPGINMNFQRLSKHQRNILS